MRRATQIVQPNRNLSEVLEKNGFLYFQENDRSGAEKTSENSFELSDETRGRRLGTIRTDDEDHRTCRFRRRCLRNLISYGQNIQAARQ